MTGFSFVEYLEALERGKAPPEVGALMTERVLAFIKVMSAIHRPTAGSGPERSVICKSCGTLFPCITTSAVREFLNADYWIKGAP